MSSLDDMINLPMNREVKRVLAVKMILLDFKTEDICALLNVSASFVSKWKIRFENEGAEVLKLNYKGGTGFLTADQRDEILFHLRMQSRYSVEELRDYIESHYGVIYHSRQSYYDLLHEAKLSWHQTQAANPQGDEAQVMQQREEIKKKLAARQADIVSGEVIVFAEDECHLVWGDTIGYVWGRQNERTEVPIANVKQRQTYYGVMNLYNQEFILNPDERGNGANTVSFIEDLQKRYPDKRFIILWDKARYHCSEEIQAYLQKVNHGLDEKEWKVTCCLFAPNAPHQNPVEDVWLQAKNFLRRHFYENKTFQQVKQSFFDFLTQ